MTGTELIFDESTYWVEFSGWFGGPPQSSFYILLESGLGRLALEDGNLILREDAP